MTGLIGLINCDVEGVEFFVFQGGSAVFGIYKPILLVELLRKWCAQFGGHPNEVLDMMNRLGYSSYALYSSARLIPIESISEYMIERNFFFVHPCGSDGAASSGSLSPSAGSRFSAPGVAEKRFPGSQGIRLDQHALQIQFAEELPQHRPVMFLAGGVAALAVRYSQG